MHLVPFPPHHRRLIWAHVCRVLLGSRLAFSLSRTIHLSIHSTPPLFRLSYQTTATHPIPTYIFTYIGRYTRTYAVQRAIECFRLLDASSDTPYATNPQPNAGR
ncbi:hypothetical protein LZ31DRAFT_88186 [Colletotrichum somersetense]|nr:hypothetical protein LZ31DRAFT_88186 [Colletotrichum somersetense]